MPFRRHVAKADRSERRRLRVLLERPHKTLEETQLVPLPPPPNTNPLRNLDFALCCTDARGAIEPGILSTTKIHKTNR